MLAQRYAFTNGTAERPALYLSTVSEPLDKIIRFGQTLSFFDVAAVGTRVIYEDVGKELAAAASPAVARADRELLRERRPGVMVIDSFKALTPYAADDREYRIFLHQLAGCRLGDQRHELLGRRVRPARRWRPRRSSRSPTA